MFMVYVILTADMANNWPREYERVTELKDADPNDMVEYTKAKHQWVRDRYICKLSIIPPQIPLASSTRHTCNTIWSK